MLIAKLTKSGAARMPHHGEGYHVPVVSGHRRPNGTGWVITVADFGLSQNGYVPFQPWSLVPGDYELIEVQYGFDRLTGWTKESVTLPADQTDKYLDRFPVDHRATADRCYQDGFADGEKSGVDLAKEAAGGQGTD